MSVTTSKYKYFRVFSVVCRVGFPPRGHRPTPQLYGYPTDHRRPSGAARAPPPGGDAGPAVDLDRIEIRATRTHRFPTVSAKIYPRLMNDGSAHTDDMHRGQLPL